jgi:DNA-binding LacI/PurR family transcriptional regulator
MRQLLDLPFVPTAVFAGGDGIAVGACLACAEAGVAIPGAMSIIGFDDAPYAATFSPELTTLRHPLNQIAATATSILLDQLDAKRVDIQLLGKPFMLPAELIVRESTGPPPAE